MIIAVAAIFNSAFAQRVILQSGVNSQLFIGTSALSEAVTASSSGDTLYLSAGSFSGTINIDKELALFGTGVYPDSSTATGNTYVTQAFNVLANNVHIEGINFQSNFYIGNNTGQSFSNINIKRCALTGVNGLRVENGVTVDGLSVVGSIISKAIYLTATSYNISFYNSILGSTIEYINEAEFLNNIFLYQGTSYIARNCSNNTFNNNIFLYSQNMSNYGFSPSDATSNIFNNNMIVSELYTFGVNPTENNTWNNIDQATIFVNQTGSDFSFDHDYHLQTPTSYIGTDGTPIGIYGGLYPKEGYIPTNPHISSVEIARETNAAGEINIKVNISAQDE